MIVVMPLGYGTMEVIDRGWITGRDPDLVRKNFMRFLDVLFQSDADGEAAISAI
jgi:hypothetical protein